MGVCSGAASVLSSLVVVLFVAFYPAANPDPVVTRVVRLLPPDHRARGREVLRTPRSALLLVSYATIQTAWRAIS